MSHLVLLIIVFVTLLQPSIYKYMRSLKAVIYNVDIGRNICII